MRMTFLTLSDHVRSAGHPSRGPVADSDVERFFAKVDRTSTCWLWTGTKYRHLGKPTYGQFWFRSRRMGAHVASHLMFNGEIPAGQEVMHSCDVKACVNPAHLSTGTRSTNLRDAKKSDPGLWSAERNGNARLTWTDVRAIRHAHSAGETQASLAAKYGVSQAHISGIVRGLKWPEPQQQEEVA